MSNIRVEQGTALSRVQVIKNNIVFIEYMTGFHYIWSVLDVFNQVSRKLLLQASRKAPPPPVNPPSRELVL